MPTIASSAPPQRPPPGDADLQELYDQVLSAFADESSPSNFSPTFSNNVDHDDSPYSPHSDEGLASQIYPRTHPQSRCQSFALLFFSFSPYLSLLSPLASASSRDNHSLSSPTSFSTSPVGKGPRPLPRPPGSSPNVTSHYPAHMPDPHIVHEPPPPVSTSSKPYPELCVTLLIFTLISHALLVCRPRSQYPAESHSNGSAASAAERAPPHRGLPSDPRPVHKVSSGLRPESGSSIDARSSSPAAGHTRNADSPQYHMPVPDTSSSSPGSYPQPWNSASAGRNYTNGLPGATLQKKTSIRPPGAAEPRIPGHTDSRDDPPILTPSLGFTSPMSSTSGSYFPRDAIYAPSFSNIPPPPPLKSPVHAQTPARPNNTLERDSSEDILAPGSHGFARPLSHSEFLIYFSGIFRTNKIIVLCLQCPAASSRCDPPALSRLQVRARADWSVI